MPQGETHLSFKRRESVPGFRRDVNGSTVVLGMIWQSERQRGISESIKPAAATHQVYVHLSERSNHNQHDQPITHAQIT